MIVCLCHRVSDRDIVQAVKGGTRCFEVLQDDLLVAASCACCHDCAREVFDQACDEAGRAEARPQAAPQPLAVKPGARRV
jgi:bacterioferritin-associated ferredoxin